MRVNLSLNYAWDSHQGSGVPGVTSFVTSQPTITSIPQNFNKKLFAEALLSAAHAEEQEAAATDPTNLFFSSDKTFVLLWRENTTDRLKAVASSPPQLDEKIVSQIHSYLATTLNAETGTYEGDLQTADITFLVDLFKNSDVLFLEEASFGMGEYQVLRYDKKTPKRSHLVQAFGKGEDQLAEEILESVWEAEKVSSHGLNGLLHGKLASICHLFPDSPDLSEEENSFLGSTVKNRYSRLKKTCLTVMADTACFFPLMRISSADKEEAKRAMFLGRWNEQCNSNLYPYIGLEVALEGKVRTKTNIDGVGACAARCSLHGCLAWSMSSEKGVQECRLCMEKSCATKLVKCPKKQCMGMVTQKERSLVWTEMGHAVALPRRTQVMGQPLDIKEIDVELNNKSTCKIIEHWTNLASPVSDWYQKERASDYMSTHDLRKIANGEYWEEDIYFSFASTYPSRRSNKEPHPCKIHCENNPLCDTVWLRLKIPFEDLGISGSGPLRRNSNYPDYMEECTARSQNGTVMRPQLFCHLYNSNDIISVAALPSGEAWLNVQEKLENVFNSYLIEVKPTKGEGHKKKQKMVW